MTVLIFLFSWPQPGNVLTMFFSFESIRRGNFAKYLFLGVWSLGKSYLFLRSFEKVLLENLMCSYEIFSWKIVCVFAEFWGSSPGNFDVFLLKNYVFAWKIHMFSYFIQASWKIWCVLDTFFLEKKNRYFSKITRLFLLFLWWIKFYRNI